MSDDDVVDQILKKLSGNRRLMWSIIGLLLSGLSGLVANAYLRGANTQHSTDNILTLTHDVATQNDTIGKLNDTQVLLSSRVLLLEAKVASNTGILQDTRQAVVTMGNAIADLSRWQEDSWRHDNGLPQIHKHLTPGAHP